jgi:hypothetical protein
MLDLLESAVNRLQLPLRPGLTADDVALIEQVLGRGREMALEDLALEIDRLNEKWTSTRSCPPELATLIEGLLNAGLLGDLASVLPGTYMETVAHLQVSQGGGQGWEGLSLDEARRLMSRADLIYELFTRERMSATQVTRLLAQWESSIDVHYRPMLAVARNLGITIRQAPEQVAAIVESDDTRSKDLFPDGNLIAACDQAAEIISLTAPGTELRGDLEALLGIDRPREAAVNYLQLLHLALLPLEDWDHPPAYLYEFAPRGQAAQAVQAMYPVETGSAALNLSKSVYCLDEEWARTKASESARALASLLGKLASLPFTSRREIARIIRSLLHRFIALTKKPLTRLPPATWTEVAAVLAHVRTRGTATKGVLEQRVMDACLAAYWGALDPASRPRGLLDPVNATNYSRRKLGDIEFQNSTDRHSEVYEIHAGMLTAPYMLAHDQGLRRGLPRRISEEWSIIDDPANWSIAITYIAHGFGDPVIASQRTIEDIPVTMTRITFGDMIDDVMRAVGPEDLTDAFERYVHESLNSRTASEELRRTYATIAEIGLLTAPDSAGA